MIIYYLVFNFITQKHFFSYAQVEQQREVKDMIAAENLNEAAAKRYITASSALVIAIRERESFIFIEHSLFNIW